MRVRLALFESALGRLTLRTDSNRLAPAYTAVDFNATACQATDSSPRATPRCIAHVEHRRRWRQCDAAYRSRRAA